MCVCVVVVVIVIVYRPNSNTVAYLKTTSCVHTYIEEKLAISVVVISFS